MDIGLEFEQKCADPCLHDEQQSGFPIRCSYVNVVFMACLKLISAAPGCPKLSMQITTHLLASIKLKSKAKCVESLL